MKAERSAQSGDRRAVLDETVFAVRLESGVQSRFRNCTEDDLKKVRKYLVGGEGRLRGSISSPR